MKLTILKLSAVLAFGFAVASCGTPKNIPYFQDIQDGSLESVTVAKTIRLLPGDKISVIVNCREQQLASMFNLSYATRYVGAVNSEVSSAGNSSGVQGYMVDADGCIDIPVLGPIKVAGLTRDETARLIKNELISRELLKEAVVTVEYLNLKVSVLGEVSRPGRYGIDRDEFTILDALSAAGDLTIFGQREHVKVLRVENGMRRTYEVNLCSAREVLSSPVYYLQQNDIVIVDPNDVRMRQSTVNGNSMRTASTWISAASLLSTIAFYIISNFAK